MHKRHKSNTAKNKLPIKTEFAAFWLLIFGGCLTIGAVVFLFFSSNFSPDATTERHNQFVPYILLLICGILTTTSGIVIFKKGKHAWKVTMVAMFFFEAAYALELHNKPYAFPKTLQADDYTIPIILIFGVATYLLPILLIIQDKKEHLETMEKRKWENNKSKEEEPEDYL